MKTIKSTMTGEGVAPRVICHVFSPVALTIRDMVDMESLAEGYFRKFN